jgi:hypothetical protein
MTMLSLPFLLMLLCSISSPQAAELAPVSVAGAAVGFDSVK